MQTSGTSGESLVDDVVKAIKGAGFTDDKGFMKRIALVESRFGTHPNTYRSGYSGGIWQVTINQGPCLFKDNLNNKHTR